MADVVNAPFELSVAAKGLIEKIAARTAVIGVIGMGYVGLPLCKTFHDEGFSIVGLDMDERKVASLLRRESYLNHFAGDHFTSLVNSDKFKPTTDMSELKNCDVAVICVPTPVGKHLEPDLSYVIGATKTIAKWLHKGQLIVLESTTYPGTTDEELKPILDETGLSISEDYFLAYSPEREDPGNANFSMRKIPKLVGGVGMVSQAVCQTLYSTAFDKIHAVSSTRVAESAKLVENIYRAVNIALVNELKIILGKMDVDVWEVLDAAETKPFGFHRFNPGAGWGGHCIPVDPFYLTWRAKAVGMTSHFIERAGEINIQMPIYVVERIVRGLNDCSKACNGAQVLLLGVAYKPNIDDCRESPSFEIWQQLAERSCVVSYNDPHVPIITDAGHNHTDLLGNKSVAFDDATLAKTDIVVIVTKHAATDITLLKNFKGPIVDTRNCVPKELGLNVIKA